MRSILRSGTRRIALSSVSRTKEGCLADTTATSRSSLGDSCDLMKTAMGGGDCNSIAAHVVMWQWCRKMCQ